MKTSRELMHSSRFNKKHGTINEPFGVLISAQGMMARFLENLKICQCTSSSL